MPVTVVCTKINLGWKGLNSCSSLEIDSLLSEMEFLNLSGEVVFDVCSIY